MEYTVNMKYSLQGQETERLIFRLLEPEDFDDWLPLFKEKNVATFLGLDPSLTAIELCESWFKKVFDRYQNDLGVMNVLIDKKTNKLIGQCGLLIQTIAGQERLEIGYSILPEFWNQGYATEASSKCKNYAFENKLRDSIISIIHIDNISSERVAIKNGMSLEKTLDSYNGMPVNIFSVRSEIGGVL